jgi:2-C-methyl-D-erythritol 4-phosphate cytidylyltransferase
VSGTLENSLGSDAVSALILAAGKGERIGGRPKALVKFAGVTLLEHVVALVRPLVSELVIGLPRGIVRKGRDILADQETVLTTGGATRQQTVARLLAKATREFVLIHEVARPFTPPTLFSAVLAAAVANGAAVAGIVASPRDSLAYRDGGFIGRELRRNDVVALQSPMAIRRDILEKVLRRADERGWMETSLANLVARGAPGTGGPRRPRKSEDYICRES